MDLSKKVFGANVDEDIRKHIERLQKGNFEIKPSEETADIPKADFLIKFLLDFFI